MARPWIASAASLLLVAACGGGGAEPAGVPVALVADSATVLITLLHEVDDIHAAVLARGEEETEYDFEHGPYRGVVLFPVDPRTAKTAEVRWEKPGAGRGGVFLLFDTDGSLRLAGIGQVGPMLFDFTDVVVDDGLGGTIQAQVRDQPVELHLDPESHDVEAIPASGAPFAFAVPPLP